MKKIVQKEAKILRKKTKEVAENEIGSAKIKNILTDMKTALGKEKNGVALAANQIGEGVSIFIVSGKLFKKTAPDLVFINPKILKKSREKKLIEEGCLSIRDYYDKIKRHSWVEIEFLNEAGELLKVKGSGLLSQIFQHEIDHLSGILFTDYIN